MKNTTLFATLCFFLAASALQAQYEFADYDFDDTAIDIPEEFSGENEIVLLKNLKIEIDTDRSPPAQYYLFHEKKWLNSDNAIERNNRVYIPFGTDETLLKNKLRVILPDGKVTQLDEGDIKEEIDEEEGMKYNYFAVSGLQKGAIIERFFVLKEEPELMGNTIYMQHDRPLVKGNLELIFPEHLGFKYKSYNGLPEATIEEEAYPKKHSLTIDAANIPKIADEEHYANSRAHVQMFRYILDENRLSGAQNIYNYNVFASNVYENVYIEPDKKARRAVDNFCKSFDTSKPKAKLLRDIEDKIKDNIAYNQQYNANADFSRAFTSRQANQIDLIRLYIAVLKKMDIETEIVFTAKRFSHFFDKDFKTLDNVRDILLHFPETGQYIEPMSFEYRTPFFNFNYGETHGLFISEREFGGTKMGVGRVGFIPLPDVESYNKMDITIDFTGDITKPEIHTRNAFGGYTALDFQPIKDFVPSSTYQSIIDEIAGSYAYGNKTKKVTSENDGMEFLGKEPFILDITYQGIDLTEMAGNNILFKAGETIGPQMELYQEEDRVLPVEIYHPKYYKRKLTIRLPENYRVKNPEAFEMEYFTVLDGETVAGFTSNYTQNGDELIVTNDEYYNLVHYPPGLYDSYRDVINAAADFNKIVLVLEKTGESSGRETAESDEDDEDPKDFTIIENAPVYPECKGNNSELKKCMETKLREHISEHFNLSVAGDLGLEGRQNIYVDFVIDKKGQVVNIEPKAPHPVLAEESIRVMELLPRFKPGKQKGEHVNVLYTIPIIFDVVATE